MNDPPDKNTAATLDFSPGLVEFYSSQATMMLSQYQNIERLLGPTDDWTAPGTYCEILLRDFLRAHFPSQYSVNKGFIYGRRQVGSETKHCPEIDILVHDTHRFRPLLQIEDFVIVQAKATKAAIQVKRRMDTDQLRKGLENVVQAKEHLAFHDDTRNLRFPSAVVFFDEKSPGGDGNPSVAYGNCIKELFADRDTWELAPDFIGSLQHHFYRRSSYNVNHLDYAGYPSTVNGQNIAIHFLLWIFTHLVSGYGTQPPMAVPQMMMAHLVDSIEITAPSAAAAGNVGQEAG
jgi:hypothetical protein